MSRSLFIRLQFTWFLMNDSSTYTLIMATGGRTRHISAGVYGDSHGNRQMKWPAPRTLQVIGKDNVSASCCAPNSKLILWSFFHRNFVINNKTHWFDVFVVNSLILTKGRPHLWVWITGYVSKHAKWLLSQSDGASALLCRPCYWRFW